MRFDFPKIDLHLHLDGSILPETAWELAREEGILPEGMDFEAFRRESAVLAPCANVNECLEKFELPIQILQTGEALERVTRELIALLASQGLVYAEIRFAPQLHTRRGMSQREAVEAVLRGRAAGLREHPEIGIEILLCAMSIGPETVNMAENLETVRLTKEYLGRGVAALDLAGAEGIVPLRNFHPIFDLARELGIPFTCHGGDSQDSETVRDAMDFGSVRIGHGHHIYEDEALCERAVREGVTFEICPTSNIRCRSRESYAAHPAKAMLDKGVRVTVNTDNMTIFDIDLEREYAHCVEEMGFTEADIRKMLRFAAEAAFLPEDEKQRLLEKLEG